MAALHASLHRAAADATSEDAETEPTDPGRSGTGALADRTARATEDALNNTSLILLLEVGGVSMLFPGDAQIENWQFTLDQLTGDPAPQKQLAGIDLYKVGHHGSRNATVSTDDLDEGEQFVEVVADATGGPFKRVP